MTMTYNWVAHKQTTHIIMDEWSRYEYNLYLWSFAIHLIRTETYAVFSTLLSRMTFSCANVH